MSYDSNNVFARILRGELPCIRIYEDETTLAFMDLMPQSDGHTLVVPKEAAATIFDISPDTLATTIQVTQKIARAVQKATEAPGVMIGQFNGAAAGQTVPHLHFHIIPRHGGEVLRAHAREQESREKLEAMAQRIIAALEK
ncbi:MAG TPA: HIT family protein [Rhodocyclaceae bacterium]|nr:HIT family protein [Rhodocyclaceae bacterium]